MNKERRDKLKRWVAHHPLVKGILGRPEEKIVAWQIAVLAWPIALGFFGESAMGLVDTKIVSGLGRETLGGVGVSVMLMYLVYSFITGTMRGVKVQTAFAVGEGTPERGSDFAWSGVVFGFLAGIVVWAIGRDIGWLLRVLRVRAELVPIASSFFAAVTWGAPATGVQAAIIQYRQGLGDATIPSRIQLAGNLVNAVLAYCLAYGKIGFPALGVRGAGYATAFAITLNAIILSCLFLRKAPGIRTIVRSAKAVVKVGLPTGMQFALELLAMVTFTIILGGIAAEEISAHQIALTLLRTSFLPGVAIGEAASVLVGQALGARSVARAEAVTKAAIRIALVYMTVCGLFFALGGRILATEFTKDHEILRITVKLLWVAAIFQIPDAVNIVLRGALRGAKDTRIPARISVLAAWLFIPSSAYFLGKVAGLGAVGGWWGFVFETFVASYLLARRWRKGDWKSLADCARDDETSAPSWAKAS